MLTLNSVHVTNPKCCNTHDLDEMCPRCRARSEKISRTLADAQEEADNITRMAAPIHNYRNWNAPSCGCDDRMTLNSTTGDDFAVREGFLVANAESEDDTESMVPPTIDWKASSAAFGKKKKAKRDGDGHDLFDPPTDNDDSDEDDDGGDGSVQNRQRPRGEIITANSENADMAVPGRGFDYSTF